VKILILSQWFQPEPFFKGLPFAQALQDRGHDVEVLTGFPNYPGGKLYPGYRLGLWQRETIDGIRVNRVALYPSHDRSGIRRMVNYLSFGLSSALIGPLLIKKPDIIYVYNLVTLGPAAGLLRLLYGCPVVYDIQDIWPDSVINSGMMHSFFLLKILERCCRFIYKQASHCVVLSPGFKKKLADMGIPPENVSVIYNWCDETALAGDKSAPSEKITGSFKIVFAGAMGTVQALDAVLEAAELLRHPYPDIQFVFVGGGVEVGCLKQKAGNLGLSNVSFLPQRPMTEIGKILDQADVLLVHLKDDPLFSITIPSKTQAYMAFGKPILMGVRGDAADLVRRANAGICCIPEDPRSIADAAIALYAAPLEKRNAMGRCAKAFYADNLSQQAGVESFERLFKAVAP
jgi:glycosyltransferase involved in cell wall biosynthesis